MNVHECLRKIAEYAAMAPSSHNSQPWKFRIAGEALEILPDYRRALPVGDPENRQLFISLGCAAENARQGAEGLGYAANVLLAGDSIRVTLKKERDASGNEDALRAIRDRITSRYAYEAGDALDELLDLVRSMRGGPVEPFICADELKSRVARIAVAASVESLNDRAFRAELASYVKSNTTRSRLGMPAYGMGIPTPVSYIAPTLIRFINVNKLSKSADEKLLGERTPYLVVIATKDDAREQWILAGQKYERIALAASRAGLSTAMWAAPIELERYRDELRGALQTSAFPQTLFRMGKATAFPPRSPRLSLAELLE